MATKKEKEELNRHLENTAIMLCGVIYGIFEDRNKEEEIKIGDDVYINGIYLSRDKEEYAIAYKQGYPDIEIPIRLDILYDGILTGIMYILRKYVK